MEATRARVDALASSTERESCREFALKALDVLASPSEGAAGTFSIVEVEWKTACSGWTPYHQMVIARVDEARVLHAYRTWEEDEDGEIIFPTLVERAAQDISSPWMDVAQVEEALLVLEKDPIDRTPEELDAAWALLFNGDVDLLASSPSNVAYTHRLRVTRREYFPLGPVPRME
jgi:hypothetical protein